MIEVKYHHTGLEEKEIERKIKECNEKTGK